MSLRAPYWVATRKDETLVLMGYHNLRDKVFRSTSNGLFPPRFFIINYGKKIDLGFLIRVDLSPEALIEDLDIQEGDRVLMFTAEAVSDSLVSTISKSL